MNSFSTGVRLVAMAGLLAAATSAAAADERAYGFFDAYIVHHEERMPERDKGFGGRIGLGVPLSESASGRLALELGVFSNPIERTGSTTADDDQFGLMLDLVHAWDIGSVDPFIFGGLGTVHEHIVGAAKQDSMSPAFELGAGTLVGLSDNIGLRIAVSAMNVRNDGVRPTKSDYTDVRAMVGLAVPFGSTKAAPAAPVVPAAPVDSDGDGVPDSADRCPAQPASTSDGCPAPVVPAAPPKDTDGDGIDDSKDECSDTLEGLKVDASGCVTQASAQKIVLKGVNFKPSSADLTPEAKTVLDEAYDALAGQSSLKVEIGGYTDSSGDDKINLALSQRRADSVRKYLVGKGIAADRLSAKGYGETQPIADNKTKEGRTQNRRVEFKLI